MSKLEWKEWSWFSEAREEGENCIRLITVGNCNGRMFYISSIVDYSTGKDKKLLGYSVNLEEAKQLHEKDLSKKLKKKGLGDGFGLE